MNKQQKKKVAVTVLLVSLLVGAAVYAALGHAYEVGFNDALDMNRDDRPDLNGHLTVLIKRGDSQEWEFLYSAENLITNAGRLALCNHIGDSATTMFDYIQVGTGSGGGVGSTALVTPFGARQQGTYADPVDYNWTITTTFAAGFFDGETITEYGVFNAVTGETMLSYQDASGDPKTLSAADSLQVIFEYMITDAG